VKILSTSDIHQLGQKWKQLVKIVQDKSPDVVVIAGDLLPKDNGILYQIQWFTNIQRYASQIRSTGAELVLILGNDDNQLLIPNMEKGDEDGLWHYVADKVVNINGYDFVGMPFVPDHPFGYKFWCAAETKDDLRIDSCQYSEPIIVNPNNEFVEIEDYVKFLMQKDSIKEALDKQASKVGDISKSIWLIHAPPSGHGLDVCCSYNKVGSYSVLDFIEKYQPLITIHGHIHESPIYGHQWKASIGNTTAIQGGQMGKDLHYVIIDLDNGIKNIQYFNGSE
jgi:Icc-related predicted phosphoesterase